MNSQEYEAAVQRAVDAAISHMRSAIEHAVRDNMLGRNMLGRKKSQPTTAKLVRFVRRVDRYTGDSRFTEICSRGLMPRSKLLKLSKLTAEQFATALQVALLAGSIELVEDEISGFECYRIPASKQAAQKPAKAVMAALDNPAQDSHTWDFATAVKQAKEREWWERG